MALVDKTTLKGYFNTGDRPNEDTFVDVFDSVLSLHGNDTQTINGDVTFDGLVAFSGSFSVHSEKHDNAGAGVAGAARNEWKVHQQDGRIVTVGTIDIQGLTSDSTDTAAIGDEGASAAYFNKIQHQDHGFIEYVSITCTEAPQGGEIDLDLVFDTTSTTEGAVVTDVVIPTGADWTVGLTRNSYNQGGTHVALTGGLDDYFVYLAVGTSSSPTNDTYTHGKFVITLIGVDFDHH